MFAAPFSPFWNIVFVDFVFIYENRSIETKYIEKRIIVEDVNGWTR